MLPRITIQQRRARLGLRHHLAQHASGVRPADLVDDLVVLHATDPASVYLSIAARSADLKADQLSEALYDDRTLIRMLGMRRTMFVVPTQMAPIVQHSSSDAVAARLRRVLVKELASVVDDSGSWLEELEESVVDRLRLQGGATALELSRAEPRLRTKLVIAEGKAYGGPTAINSRVLNLIASQGRIVRGRPAGGWVGSHYEWAPVEKWLPTGLPIVDAEQARIDLVRRWLGRFGPGTLDDIVWWTGWNLGETRRALAGIETGSVELDGGVGLVLADDGESVAEPPPWIALLPALDPTPMGWVGRDWYIDPEHRKLLFDRTGNIGPSVWSDGRIVGGWGQRADGVVVWRLFTDIGTDQTAKVADEATRLTEWIDGVKVIPKFRTPLERELSA
jgi:hypothetical protein